MTRESAETKGSRYLVEHRLVITLVSGTHIHATCRGSGATYELGHEPGRWYCNCPARGRCSHLVALMACTSPRSTG